MPLPDPVDKPAPLHREESTTPGLVERWRQAAEAAYRGDLDATMGIFAADAVWEVLPLGISHRGAPAIRSFLEEWGWRTDEGQGLWAACASSLIPGQRLDSAHAFAVGH